MLKNIILFTIAVVAVVLIYTRYNDKPLDITNPEKKIPSYKITSDAKNINIINEVDLFDGPKEQPVYNITLSTLDINSLVNTAGILNFQDAPLVVSDYFDGDTYIWKNINKALTYYTNPSRFLYSNGQDLVGNITKSDQVLVNTSLEFINSFPINADLYLSNIVYLGTSDNAPEHIQITDKEVSQIAQINFKVFDEPYPLVNQNPNSSPIYTWVTENLVNSRANITSVKKVEKSDNNFPIKDLNQINNSLPSAKLVSINNGATPLDDISNVKINVVIDNIELAYYYNEGDQIQALPIFILTGKASIPGLGDDNLVNLYLPAIVGAN